MLFVSFCCLKAAYPLLWAESKQKGCVACAWINKRAVVDLFLQKGGGGGLHQLRVFHKFWGIPNLEDVYIR